MVIDFTLPLRFDGFEVHIFSLVSKSLRGGLTVGARCMNTTLTTHEYDKYE